MKLISDAYRQEQTYLHFAHPKKHKYGTGGPPWVDTISQIAVEYQCASILDYGCGKGLLRQLMPNHNVRLYDPAMPQFNAMPQPADLVVCLDVMEHVEPECLDDVFRHLLSLIGKRLFVTISLKTAGRSLRDGRNAHLIVKDSEWWRDQFEKRNCIIERVFPPRVTEWVALINKGG